MSKPKTHPLSQRIRCSRLCPWRSVGAISFVCAAVLMSAFPVAAATDAKPNVLLILADDMGYGDLGCMGSKLLRTPNLDALADSGVLCTQAYVASSVCSPSRAGLLTGRDPRRFGYEGNLNAAASSYATRPELLGLPPNEKTIGDHLGAAGYATALIGKWHLGMGEGFHPNRRGFDFFCGMLKGSHSYFPTKGKHSIERNGEPVATFSSDYLTDFFTDEALRYLQNHRSEKPDKPWFMYLSYNAPHGPLHATEQDLAAFPDLPEGKRKTYAAMMLALDRGVGRVVDYLKESEQAEDTLIVFFSDNGGATGNASWNGPLRGVKGCLREGGIRIPMIWSWPGSLPAGRRCESVVSALDMLPTFIAAAGAEMLPLSPPMSHEDGKNRQRMVKLAGTHDGINVLPVLRGETDGPARRLYWRLQGQAAILDGDTKLVRLSHRRAELFETRTDAGEHSELSSSQPDKMETLFRALGAWEAALPTVPLWGSSPYWTGESARHYDGWEPRPEPLTQPE